MYEGSVVYILNIKFSSFYFILSIKGEWKLFSDFVVKFCYMYGIVVINSEVWSSAVCGPVDDAGGLGLVVNVGNYHILGFARWYVYLV